MHYVVEDIRKHFIYELQSKRFTSDRTGARTIELLGASFIADEKTIFGTENQSYIDAEIKWYLGKSTNINSMQDTANIEPPKAWKTTANQYGEINSNYGHIIFSDLYYNQYYKVVNELIHNRDSRRAIMVYNRPSIWIEGKEDGKNDFICTNAHTYYIRDNKLHVVVQMRSNDVVFGYKNDYAWAKYIQEEIRKDLIVVYEKLELGDIFWQVQNLHIYDRHFWIVDCYNKFGKNLTKEEYDEYTKNTHGWS